MRGCYGWSAPLFFATPTTLATLAIVLLHMFVHSVDKDESAHMHSLAIASTAGLNKMININHVAHLMKLARIWLYYKIDNVRTS